MNEKIIGRVRRRAVVRDQLHVEHLRILARVGYGDRQGGRLPRDDGRRCRDSGDLDIVVEPLLTEHDVCLASPTLAVRICPAGSDNHVADPISVEVSHRNSLRRPLRGREAVIHVNAVDHEALNTVERGQFDDVGKTIAVAKNYVRATGICSAVGICIRC